MVSIVKMLWLLLIIILSVMFSVVEGFKTKQLKRRIRENKYAIASNTTNISDNTTNISDNTTNIENNKNNIASNKNNIASNTTNIGDNTTEINENNAATELALQTIENNMINNYARIPQQYHKY